MDKRDSIIGLSASRVARTVIDDMATVIREAVKQELAPKVLDEILLAIVCDDSLDNVATPIKLEFGPPQAEWIMRDSCKRFLNQQ